MMFGTSWPGLAAAVILWLPLCAANAQHHSAMQEAAAARNGSVTGRDNGGVVFDGVHVVHLKQDTITRDQRIVVVGERISAVGPPAAVAIPQGARVVDARGWYALPGFYEMHAHIPPHGQGEQRAQDVLKLFLANGVTTVRGMLGEPWHLELRAMLARGDWVGPRLITSGPSFNGRSVEGPKQAEQMVKAQAAAGYDFLKLHPGLGPLEFAAIARTARLRQIPFAGHVSVDVGLRRTLRAGQASIDHLDGYAQELLPAESPLRQRDPGFFGIAIAAGLRADKVSELARDTRAAGVWNVPTQSLLENILGRDSIASLSARPEMIYVDAATRQQWERSVRSLRNEYSAEERQRFLHVRRLLIAALQDAGAGLLLGSDAPQIMNVPGFSVHQELAVMVAAGLTPRQALLAGTSLPARFFGEDDQRAWIAPGFVADVVFLRGNPLEDIAHTRAVQGVYQHGEWYARAQLDRWLAEVAQHAGTAQTR